MSDQLHEAQKRRIQLRNELALIEQYIELHTRLFGNDRVSQATPLASAHDAGQTRENRNSSRRGMNNPKEIADAALRILSESEVPMSRGRLIKALRDNGVEIHSKDAGKYLGTILWRDSDRFVNIEGEGYWPSNRPLPTDESPNHPLFR